MQHLIERVRLKNYKSIASCDVRLGGLTFLIGPNGSGKSNFLDSLRFVADGLSHSIEYAFRDRAGIGEVRRRSGGHPTHFGVRLDLRLPDGATAHFAFEVAARPNADFEVRQEQCKIRHKGRQDFYEVRSGKLRSKSFVVGPPALKDRLYLVSAAGLPEFRPVFDALSRMGFYNLNPQVIRDPQSPDPGLLLTRDGSNLASVLQNMQKNSKGVADRIQQYLSAVVRDIHSVEHIPVGKKETLQFRMQVASQGKAWRFSAANMSDGTLRALGVLVALFQSVGRDAKVPLVGIEEPESALHPGAAATLFDALMEGAAFTQVVVTSHSPELLDNSRLDPESILSVEMKEGITFISKLDQVKRELLKSKLFTAGELFRKGQLLPESGSTQIGQLNLFDQGME